MEHAKSPSTLSLGSASAFQKLKDRARSVDRFLETFMLPSYGVVERCSSSQSVMEHSTTAKPDMHIRSESRLNILGQSRESTNDPTRPIEKSHSFQNGRTIKDSEGSQEQPKENIPVTKTRQGSRQSARRPRRDGSLSTADVQKSSTRWRSPSISRSLQRNFQSLVSFLFERKYDARKRALAEQLLWTALRRQETALFVDILAQLQDPPLDLNRPNQFGWRLVDEAVMLDYPAIAKELFHRGAKETPGFLNKSIRMEALARALRGLDAIQAASRLRSNPHPRLLAAELAAIPSINILQLMIHNVERTRAPRNYVDKITVEPWDEDAVAFTFLTRTASPGIISRFKVEWCLDGTFTKDVASQTFLDLMDPPRLIVADLLKDQPFFFRLYVGNMAGFGTPALAQPSPLTITSWRDLSSVTTKTDYEEALLELQAILERTLQVAHQVENQATNVEQPRNEPSLRSVARRPSIKDSIKAIIKPHNPTLTAFDGGLFLSCLVINDDFLLLCDNFSLPSNLIQNQFLGTVTSKDYARLHKLSCQSLDFLVIIRNLLASSKDASCDLCYSITQALLSLRSWLCLDDLGLPYLHPLYDHANNISLMLLVGILTDKDYVLPSGLRWVHIKEVEALSLNEGLDPLLAMVVSVGIQEINAFARSARKKITSGLHLSFLELHCTLDNVAVQTTKGRPGMLPTVKLRDNPHVTSDEWDSILHLPKEGLKTDKPLVAQQVTTAWHSLRRLLSIRPDEHDNPYLFEEVVRIDDQTAIIVLHCDQGELKSASTPQEQRRGMLQVAVQMLEYLFFETYHKDLWVTYCQASLLQESLAVHLLHRQRQVYNETAFASIKPKQHQEHLAQLQTWLDKVWNGMRWLPNVVRQTTHRHRPRRHFYSLEQLQTPPSFTTPNIPLGTMIVPDDVAPTPSQSDRLCLSGFVARQVRRIDRNT